MPAPEIPKPHRVASVRSALSEHDILHLSDEELQKRGYPPRPNPEQAANAFNAWRKAVSMPVTVVKPQTISDPEIFHGSAKIVNGPAYSDNWSGFELRGTGPYSIVVGTWHVPDVATQRNTGMAYSSFWVGIDGDNTADGPVQAGTEQQALWVQDVTFGDYYPWWSTSQPYRNNDLQTFPLIPGTKSSRRFG